MIFEEAVDTLLKQNVRITNRQVRLLTNLSRQTIATYLGRLVDNGQLIRTGKGRSLSYEPGKERTEPSRTLPESNRFWTELAAKDPDLRYVRIATTCPRRTRRSDAEPLCSYAQRARRVVLDFEGAEDASVPFLQVLLFESLFELGDIVLTINQSPALKQKVELAGRMYWRAAENSVQ